MRSHPPSREHSHGHTRLYHYRNVLSARNVAAKTCEYAELASSCTLQAVYKVLRSRSGLIIYKWEV